MKKLIVLSVACLFAFGAFASTENKTGNKAKAKAQTTASVTKAPAKTESKPACCKKGAKGAKCEKKGMKTVDAKKAPVSEVK